MQRSAIDRAGQVVAGRYQITGSLSVGAMATVYSAASVTTGAPFAIKILHDEVLERGSLHERFQREHLVCSRLQSSQCLQILEFGTLESGVPFQVMEYVPGESLAEILDREERLPMNRALVLFSRVLEALVACGDAGIIHRDIKPENVLIVRDQQGVERVKLIGFGIAKLIGQAAEGHDRLTSVGLVLGTPHYIAPEWVSSDNVDSRSDLYSATVMLFEMLTSAPPFLHEDKREIMKMHLQSPPPRLADRVPGEVFLEELEELIQIGLAKDPAARFPNAREYLNRVAGLNSRAGIVGGAAASPVVSSSAIASPAVSSSAIASPAMGQPMPPQAYAQGQSPVVATAPPRAITTEVPAIDSRSKTSPMWIFGGVFVAMLLGLLAVVVGSSSSDE
ncbi:MAG: serine/threonine protein kinase, partial [Kofleriaceae bacterium]|nr:serine/threonine protein kinase [Kofleriaceae bacterium]